MKKYNNNISSSFSSHPYSRSTGLTKRRNNNDPLLARLINSPSNKNSNNNTNSRNGYNIKKTAFRTELATMISKELKDTHDGIDDDDDICDDDDEEEDSETI